MLYNQPQTGLIQIDKANPLTVSLLSASICLTTKKLFDIGANSYWDDPYSGDSLKYNGVSEKGLWAGFGGGSYRLTNNKLTGKPSGKSTTLIFIRPKVSNTGSNAPILTAGELNGNWTFNCINLGSGTAAKFAGSSVGQASSKVIADSDYIIGRHYAVAFTTNFDIGSQRLFIDGVRQSGAGTYAGGVGKKLDYLTLGSTQIDNAAELYGVFIWERVLSDSEIAMVSANPWQLFADPLEEEYIAALDFFGNVSNIVSAIGSIASSSSVFAIGQKIAKSIGSLFTTSTVSSNGVRIAQSIGLTSSVSLALAIGRKVVSVSGTANSISSVNGYAQRITKISGLSISNTTAIAVGRTIKKVIGTANGYSIVQGYNTASRISSAIGSIVSYTIVNAVGRSVRKSFGVSYGYSDVDGYNLASKVTSSIGLIVSGSSVSAVGRSVRRATGLINSQVSLFGYSVRFVVSKGESNSYSNTQGFAQIIRKSAGYTNGNSTVNGYSYVESSIRISLTAVLPKVYNKILPVVLKATKPY